MLFNDRLGKEQAEPETPALGREEGREDVK